MNLYRIASLDYAVFSGVGAALSGGRWNSVGNEVIYTCTSLACSRLELMAHMGFNAKPANYGYVKITVPKGIAATKFPGAKAPPWAHAWGDIWLKDGKTLLAKVPSVASPGDYNYLINPRHPDFTKLAVGPEMPAEWDDRHFRRKKKRKGRISP